MRILVIKSENRSNFLLFKNHIEGKMSGGFAGLPTSSISNFTGSCHGSAALTIYSLGRHTINNM
jgi:hypothetical protein